MLRVGKGVRVAYCHECGERVGEDWAFCRSCGQQLAPGARAGAGRAAPAPKLAGRRWAVAGLVAVLLASGAGIAALLNDRTEDRPDVAAKQTSATDIPLASHNAPAGQFTVANAVRAVILATALILDEDHRDNEDQELVDGSARPHA